MDRIVAARKLLGELVNAEEIECRRPEIVGRDVAAWVDKLGRPPSGDELEAFLDEHAQVTELYASKALLEELVYRYLTPPPAETVVNAVDARHPELERELREGLDSVEPYTVYADWLQEQSDPLGELIALGVAATASSSEEDNTRFQRYLKLHEARLLGGLSRELADRVTLGWHNGLVRSIEEHQLNTLHPRVWEQLLKLRVCEFVRAISIHRQMPGGVDEAVAEHAPETFRELSLGYSAGLPEHLMKRDLRSLTLHGGQIAIAADTLPPSLERLELRVHEVGGLPVQLSVRELHVRLTLQIAAFLTNVKLPRVEHFVVDLEGSSLAPLLALLDDIEFPALTALRISDGILEPKQFDKLAKLPHAARLTSLALTNMELTDELIESLTRAAKKFPSLTSLDVSFNELTREGLQAARAFTPNVVSTRQHKRGNGAEKRIRRFAGSRLTVAEEIADASNWKKAGVDGDIRWGRYRGNDEYELFISIDLKRYGCSCPSSIQPCKHVVALALYAERSGLPEKTSDGIEERVARITARTLIQTNRYDEIEE